MDDESITGPIFTSTKQAGFEAVTWLDAGTRNFYTVNTPINTPADLKGLKIRVQQSPTNIQMMNLLGGSATPMGFGDVYTALQSKIIDGAENNELALTDNGHGDVCKYYSYDMHQMIPDILIGNVAFLDGLSDEERAIFEEGFQLVNQVQRRNGPPPWRRPRTAPPTSRACSSSTRHQALPGGLRPHARGNAAEIPRPAAHLRRDPGVQRPVSVHGILTGGERI